LQPNASPSPYWMFPRRSHLARGRRRADSVREVAPRQRVEAPARVAGRAGTRSESAASGTRRGDQQPGRDEDGAGAGARTTGEQGERRRARSEREAGRQGGQRPDGEEAGPDELRAPPRNRVPLGTVAQPAPLLGGSDVVREDLAERGI